MVTFFRTIFVALGICGLLAGCAKPGPIGADPSTVVADLASLPAPGARAVTPGGAGDTARPLDVLTITTFGVPELSRSVRVGAGGYLDFPLIGAVQASGRSLAEIGYEIENRLQDGYVRSPDVTVEFSSRQGQVFTIGGEVQEPGQYPILQSMTLLEAIAIGGGQSDFAQLEEVLVFREVDGQRFIGVYDVRGIQRGNYPDPQIYAHDLVMVGDSPNRRMLAEMLQYAQLVTTPLILLQQVVGRN